MDASHDFEDRLAARLLGLPVDADAAAVRGRFRALVKALHPDLCLLDACIDLGGLAEARDRLLERAARRDAETAARLAAVERRRVAAAQLEAMRPRPAVDVPVVADARVAAVAERVEARAVERAKARHPSADWQPRPSAVTARYEAPTTVGRRIDLAG